MGSRLPEKQHRVLTTPTKVETTDLMIRALIRHVIENAYDYGSSDPEEMNVLLDTEVDGVRCLLVSIEPSPDEEEGATHRGKVLLSPREEEIARMVAAGYPNKTIAAVLDISSWTVGTHLRRVFAKLGVGSRAAMVASLLKTNRLKNPPKSA
jgi:DNA-binding CsgD family transcriptional regulator